MTDRERSAYESMLLKRARMNYHRRMNRRQACPGAFISEDGTPAYPWHDGRGSNGWNMAEAARIAGELLTRLIYKRK